MIPSSTALASLAAKNVSLSHSECLEIVARQFGFADWNVLAAKIALETGARGPRPESGEIELPLANGHAVADVYFRMKGVEALRAELAGRLGVGDIPAIHDTLLRCARAGDRRSVRQCAQIRGDQSAGRRRGLNEFGGISAPQGGNAPSLIWTSG